MGRSNRGHLEGFSSDLETVSYATALRMTQRARLQVSFRATESAAQDARSVETTSGLVFAGQGTATSQDLQWECAEDMIRGTRIVNAMKLNIRKGVVELNADVDAKLRCSHRAMVAGCRVFTPCRSCPISSFSGPNRRCLS
jgi:hypothetical protein